MKNHSYLPKITLTAVLALLGGCFWPADLARAQTTSSATAVSNPASNSESASKKTRTSNGLPPGIAKPPAPFEGKGWESLFNGRDLTGWRKTDFAGSGDVQVRAGVVLLNMGDPFTGINYTNEFPKMNYEVGLDAMRIMGTDFFCGLTVPVGDSYCSLIVGGWGGALVGISSLDYMDASENSTTTFHRFEKGRWYRIRLRITPGRIEAWIDQEKVVDVVTTGTKISLRPGDIELSKPFGIASWETGAALREIKMRRVDKPSCPPPKSAYLK
jgi:3-keto-disaccharide hydrolase